MGKIITSIALVGMLGLNGCYTRDTKYGPVEEGVIKEESFYPSGEISSQAMYFAIVKLFTGEEVLELESERASRVANNRYNVGDTVKVRDSDANLVGSGYRIEDPIVRNSFRRWLFDLKNQNNQ